MADRVILSIGTRKGLWLGTSDEARTAWDWTGPHFPMEEVYSVMIDTRGEAPRLLAGASSSWLGPQVWRSDDLGTTWGETPNDTRPAACWASRSRSAAKRCIAAAHSSGSAPNTS